MAATTLKGKDLARVRAKALEQVHEAVAIITTDFRIAWVNGEFCRLTGHDRREIVGQPVRTLRSDLHDEAYYEAMYRILSEEGRWQGEVWRRKKSGEPFPALLTVSTIHDDATGTDYFVDLFIDIDRLREGRERLEFAVNHDPLTELPNRRLFWDRLELVLKRVQRYDDARLALIFVDLDNFKRVNDSFGHLFGDRLLIRVAEALQGCLRGADTIARVGGDEFVVLLEGHDPAIDGEAASERIRATLDALWAELPASCDVGASLGLATYPDDGTDAETLYAVADERMYAAKRRRSRDSR